MNSATEQAKGRVDNTRMGVLRVAAQWYISQTPGEVATMFTAERNLYRAVGEMLAAETDLERLATAALEEGR